MEMEWFAMAVRIRDPVSETKNAVVVVVLIFIKNNGLCGITEKSTPCTKIHV